MRDLRVAPTPPSIAGGVFRLGHSDFYSIVEDIPDIVDSLVVHLEDPAGDPVACSCSSSCEPLWRCNITLTWSSRLRTTIKTELSPRHVPDTILAVPRVPRTLTGKKLRSPSSGCSRRRQGHSRQPGARWSLQTRSTTSPESPRIF